LGDTNENSLRCTLTCSPFLDTIPNLQRFEP
jgi:hypothetical protein